MAVKSVDVPNTVGLDGPGGATEVDAKQYHTFMVNSTKHLFSAPVNKYKDLKTVLGLTDVDTDDAKKEKGQKLAQGSGYVHLKVKVKKGGTLMVVSDPDKVGDTRKSVEALKIYDKDIDRVYIPKKQVFI